VIWRLAWRNLWRHRARTWILVSVIAATYALSLVGLSIGDDSHQRMLREAARVAGGDVLVHGDGYWENKASDIAIPAGDPVVEALRGIEEVVSVHPRVLINGLVSTSAASRPVFLQGVDPDLEVAFRGFGDDIVDGTFLAEEERDDPLVLGAELAEELDVEIGDRVVLTASGPDGEIQRALFHLTGTLDAGAGAANEVLGFTTVEAAAEALGMEGALTQVGLTVASEDAVERVAARAREVLAGVALAGEAPTGEALSQEAQVEGEAGGRGEAPPGMELEVLTWREAVPEMVGFVELDDAFGHIYMIVIFVVVLFAITNTFLMAVMERVREFGLLSALGLRDRQVGTMLLAETVVLTALAMTIGLTLGLAGHFAANHWGISVAAYGIDEIEISGIDMADMVIHSTITPAKWIAASVMVAVASVASALYPAWKAMRLAPSEAMRFYE